jgi:hypothetical protein
MGLIQALSARNQGDGSLKPEAGPPRGLLAALAQREAPAAVCGGLLDPRLYPRGSSIDNDDSVTAALARLGFDPNVETRTNVLPDPRDENGNPTWDLSKWTAPWLVYDLARAMVTPGVAMNGGAVTDDDMLNLALGMAGGSVGATAAKAAAREAESLASRGATLYNGPRTERLFSADYPHGHQADAAGNLALDIDGNPLQVGGRIVGRCVAGGADQALSPAEFDAIAKAATGRDTATLPQSALGRNVGRVAVNRYSRLPTQVELSNKLTPEQLPGVYGHEIGHVIDQMAGEIPTGGLTKELKALYDTGNNPNRMRDDPARPAGWGKPWTPQAAGYKGEDVPREWMAEAIRLYMANPSYLKEAAPETAKAIRKTVNSNPDLARIIQFNATAAPISPLPGNDPEKYEPTGTPGLYQNIETGSMEWLF